MQRFAPVQSADKAVWGRAVLFSLLAAFLVPAVPADAQFLTPGNRVSAPDANVWGDAATVSDMLQAADEGAETTTNTIEETTSSLRGDLTGSGSSNETTSPNDATSAPTNESASTTEAAPATTHTTSSGSTTTTTGLGLLNKLGAFD